MASGQDLGDDLRLKAAERFMAKGAAQHVQGGIGIGQGEHGAGMPAPGALRHPAIIGGPNINHTESRAVAFIRCEIKQGALRHAP
jgi:hypothetical protein